MKKSVSNWFGKEKNLGVIAVAVIGLALVLSAYINLTGFAIQSQNMIEKTATIQVWANSQIELTTQQDTLNVKVLLDNGTELPDQKVDLYINSYQSPELKNKSLFNLSTKSPGTYNLKVLAQGSPTQFINPTTLESQIEISVKDGEKQITILENSTIRREPEEAVQLIPEANTNCQEFEQAVLWSSSFSNSADSTNYESWIPEFNCESINSSSCTIGNVEVETRFISALDNNQNGEGSIQISTLGNSVCQDLESQTYGKYLAYETLNGEGKKIGQYCGNNKNPNSKCGIEFEDDYSPDLCYGIKLHADQQFIVDAFKIKYSLCEANQ